jgi:hypothetical protein
MNIRKNIGMVQCMLVKKEGSDLDEESLLGYRFESTLFVLSKVMDDRPENYLS